jgi:hypothetical protein
MMFIASTEAEIDARTKQLKTTKSLKIMSETEKKAKLTDRQLKTIPHIVACPTYTEG